MQLGMWKVLRNPWSCQGRERALCWLVSVGPAEAAGYNSGSHANRNNNDGKRLHSTDGGPDMLQVPYID